MSLQHGVPLKVLVEKFAHTRFEPSGWTGNEQIGYAKSIMDYLFRWMQLRFLSGQQLDLFAGLKQPTLVAQSSLSDLIPSLAASVGEEAATPEPHTILGEAFERNDRTPPQQGIAPDLEARSGFSGLSFRSAAEESASPLTSIPDRSIFHASDAMKGMYDMGDAPSCSTCGAIMVRNGACHRCMECGSTSGCS
jgi:ribonucleoside-diphosphate reductase alpha chain